MRITEGLLASKLHRLNCIVFDDKVPAEHFAIGKFHLYSDYGKWQLRQCKLTGGQADDVLRCGLLTKRELYEKMDAFISGILFEKHKGE